MGSPVERGVGRPEPERDSGGVTYRWLVENFTPEGQSTIAAMVLRGELTGAQVQALD